MSRLVPLAAALALIAFVAPASGQTYYDDVRPVLVENCVSCHSEAGVAWSMEDAERTYDRARRIARAIERRHMPPFLAERGHQQYVGDSSLDDATLEMVRRWAEADYPRGEVRADVSAAPMDHPHGAFDGQFSLAVLPEEGYLPNQESNDDYRCFLVDWTAEEPAYVTGFRAIPGNRRVGHHVVVHAVDPDMWDRYREVEDLEEGPGYSCFGGALPSEAAQIDAYEAKYPGGLEDLDASEHWLAHWAPGMDGHVFPEGTGLLLEPGAGLVVQMHYYAGAAPGERDQDTYVEFMTTPYVERPAMHLPQTRSGDWFLPAEDAVLVVEPGEIRTYEHRDELSDVLDIIAGRAGVPVEDVDAIEIHSANLHMHAIGHSGEITLTHPSGEVEVLLRVPRWDLNWQRDFTFVEPKVLRVEDLEGAALTVQCTFENTTEETVIGGLGSGDEMCFNFSYISVRPIDRATTTSGGGAQR